jgi:hypothetical protein
MDKEQLTQQYQNIVRQYLDKLTDRLVAELKVIAHAKHDPETYLLDFEVEMQDFTRAFPVYWFPMDKDATRLETSLSLSLLADIEFTVPEEVVEAVAYEEAGIETWELGYDALVAWFGECWRKADGLACAYPAYIAPHDSFHSVNLKTMQGVTDDEKWPPETDQSAV